MIFRKRFAGIICKISRFCSDERGNFTTIAAAIMLPLLLIGHVGGNVMLTK